VRGLYAYDAQGDDELSVIEGGTLELTPGGEEYADGWYQGVDSRGKIVSSLLAVAHFSSSEQTNNGLAVF
jgi:hypothetical protein